MGGTELKRRTRLTSEQRREVILAAALDVFGVDGYRDGSLQEIAERSGLTVPGVLHHFPTKVELLVATLDRWQTTALEDVAIVDDARAVGRSILRRNMRNPGVMRLRVTISAEATSPTHPAYERMRARYELTHDRWSEIIADGLADGRYQAIDPEMGATLLIALLDGLQLEYLLRPEMDLVGAFDIACERLLGPAETPVES